MLEALEKTLGIVTSACQQAGIPRRTHYNWYSADPDYAGKVDELQSVAVDFAEGKLFKLIQDGDTTATIFFLKTKGKSRGYSQSAEKKQDNKMDSNPFAKKLRKAE